MIFEHEGIKRYWGDGENTFRLRVGELKALQQSCGALFLVYGRIVSTQCTLEDVTEVLRLGLIGGGKPPKDASDWIENWVYRPARYLEAADLALEVINAAVRGDASEELPKSQAPEEENDASSIVQMDTSPSEKSTPT